MLWSIRGLHEYVACQQQWRKVCNEQNACALVHSPHCTARLSKHWTLFKVNLIISQCNSSQVELIRGWDARARHRRERRGREETKTKSKECESKFQSKLFRQQIELHAFLTTFMNTVASFATWQYLDQVFAGLVLVLFSYNIKSNDFKINKLALSALFWTHI